MAQKNTVNSGENTNNITSQNVKIRLKDGTELNVILNGNTYESAEPIADAVLSPDNVSKVEIGGEAYENMILICKYEYEGGTRFALREMTDAEAENKNLRRLTERRGINDHCIGNHGTIKKGDIAQYEFYRKQRTCENVGKSGKGRDVHPRTDPEPL